MILDPCATIVEVAHDLTIAELSEALHRRAPTPQETARPDHEEGDRRGRAALVHSHSRTTNKTPNRRATCHNSHHHAEHGPEGRYAPRGQAGRATLRAVEDYTSKYKGEQVEVALFGGEYQEGVLTAYCYVDEVAHIELNGHILVPLQNIASLHCSSRCDAPQNEDWPPRGLLEDDGQEDGGEER